MKLSFGSDVEESALPPPGGVDVSVAPGGTPKKRGRPPGSTSRVKLDELEKKLTEKLLEELIVPVAFASPLAAANIEARAERTAKAACRMASKNPAIRKGIERMLDGSDVMTLILFPVSTAVCFMVDWNMMPLTSIPARAVGAPRLAEEIYGEDDPERLAELATSNGHNQAGSRGLMEELP